jgi:hypothetical protein
LFWVVSSLPPRVVHNSTLNTFGAAELRKLPAKKLSARHPAK